MSQVKNITRFVAAIALVAGFAFVVPPASAAEQTDTQAEEDQGADPCIPFTYEGETGPANYRISGCGDVDVGTADDSAGLSTTQTIPPCAAFHPEVTVGPATAGIDPYCSAYVVVDQDLRPGEDPTEKCSVSETDDPKLVMVECELSGPQNCIQVYWEYEVGPVSWEHNACSSDDGLQVDEDWRPDASLETTDNCFYIYWKKQVGPVVWEQRSSCDGDIYVDSSWQPSDEIPE